METIFAMDGIRDLSLETTASVVNLRPKNRKGEFGQGETKNSRIPPLCL